MFINGDSLGDAEQVPEGNTSQPSRSEESIKMTLTGTRKAVDRMIGLLHRYNIISGSEWSHPIAIKNSTEVLSVASRVIRID